MDREAWHAAVHGVAKSRTLSHVPRPTGWESGAGTLVLIPCYLFTSLGLSFLIWQRGGRPGSGEATYSAGAPGPAR